MLDARTAGITDGYTDRTGEVVSLGFSTFLNVAYTLRQDTHNTLALLAVCLEPPLQHNPCLASKRVYSVVRAVKHGTVPALRVFNFAKHTSQEMTYASTSVFALVFTLEVKKPSALT